MSKLQEIFLCASEKVQSIYSDFLDELAKEFCLVDIDQYRSEQGVILLLGGDGSLNYFLNEYENIIKTRPKVLYFPSGTANDFARSLKIDEVTPSLNKVRSIMSRNDTVNIPLMKCNDRLFINVASVGGPAKVTDCGDSLLKKLTGKISYYVAGVQELLNTTQYRIVFSDNLGRNFEYLTSGFIISQGLYAGGGIKVSTSYSPNFGEEFNFITVDGTDLSVIVRAALEMQKDEPLIENNLLISKMFTDIAIHSNEEMPAKLDGEDYVSKLFYFKKSELSLKFYLH